MFQQIDLNHFLLIVVVTMQRVFGERYIGSGENRS